MSPKLFCFASHGYEGLNRPSEEAVVVADTSGQDKSTIPTEAAPGCNLLKGAGPNGAQAVGLIQPQHEVDPTVGVLRCSRRHSSLVACRHRISSFRFTCSQRMYVLRQYLCWLLSLVPRTCPHNNRFFFFQLTCGGTLTAAHCEGAYCAEDCRVSIIDASAVTSLKLLF